MGIRRLAALAVVISLLAVVVAGCGAAGVASEEGSCDPNYSPCVPDVAYDLDCGDLGYSVQVVGGDPHGFDRDDDGIGCE